MGAARPASGEADPAVAPSLALLAREAMVFANFMSGKLSVNRIAAQYAPGCDARPVMLVPGFLSSARSMFVLHQALERAGYPVTTWGLGRNLGAQSDTLDRLAANVASHGQRHGGPVTMIGWSLGGVFSRELAKRSPDLVREVLTLGTPFSGSPRANNAWRLYERVAGHPVDAPPIDTVLHEKPPVPTFAFWSRRDGVIAPACARGESGQRDRAIELDCGHLGFASKPSAVSAILAQLESTASV
ncbi:MAG: alpha/beta hydrolase [Blastomonas sp.]